MRYTARYSRAYPLASLPAAKIATTGSRNAHVSSPSTTEEMSSMEKALPITREASSLSPRPRAMEQSGAPPWPKSPANAERMEMTGSAMPTPVSAMLPMPGIWPM